MKTEVPHAGESIQGGSLLDSSSEIGRGARAQGRVYLGGMVLVLILAVASSGIEARLYRDATILATLLLLLLLFYRLMASFRCTRLVKVLTLCGAGAIVLGQLLNTTEELAVLNAVPILGRDSVWNAFFDSLFGKTGIIAMFGALVIAVIELSVARDNLERDGDRLAEEIVERVEAQRELAAHRDHLEELVAERTAALEESQRALLAKERKAMLGEIMSTVSHQIRSPLGAVRSSLFTLKRNVRRVDSDEVSRAIERAERNIIRCDRIIEELRDLSRARDIVRRVTPLDAWLKGVLEAAAIPETIRFETDLRADTAISLDRDKMRRAVLNLISNSVQAFEEGEGREQRLMVSSLREGDVCRIRITDTGTGMAADVLNKLGTPLFSTRPTGVGLGVPVVQETVQGHGGRVSYQSEVGKGTSVEIELPLPLPGAISAAPRPAANDA